MPAVATPTTLYSSFLFGMHQGVLLGIESSRRLGLPVVSSLAPTFSGETLPGSARQTASSSESYQSSRVGDLVYPNEGGVQAGVYYLLASWRGKALVAVKNKACASRICAIVRCFSIQAFYSHTFPPSPP